MVFGAAPSVRDYYAVQSGRRVELTEAGVLGWFDARHPHEHYWSHPADTSCGFDNGHVEKWTESIRRADAELDFARYDANRDGTLAPSELGICIVIPQNEPFGTVRGTAGRQQPTYEPLVVDGVAIPTISEVYCGAQPNFGAFAHELGHLLFDLPDMYGAPQPAGHYSLMDISYTDALIDPCNKLRLGWLDLREASAGRWHSLRHAEGSREALLLSYPIDPLGPFYLLELRRRGTYDRAIPAEGLAVWEYDPTQVGDWGRLGIRLVRAPAPSDLPAPEGEPTAFLVELAKNDGSGLSFLVSASAASRDELQLEVELRTRNQ